MNDQPEEILSLKADNGDKTKIFIVPPFTWVKKYNSGQSPKLMIVQISRNGSIEEDFYDMDRSDVWKAIFKSITRLDIEMEVTQ